MSLREALIQKARAQDWHAPDWRHRDLLPVVSLEDFFEGNSDQCSMATNLEPHPGLGFLFSSLCAIRVRPDVQAVLVEITDMEEAEAMADAWPYSERVYVLAAVDRQMAADWNAQLRADGPVEGWATVPPPAAPALAPGHRVWQIIWD